MDAFGTLVARYRATLANYADNQHVPIATDQYGKVVLSDKSDSTDLFSSIRIGDATGNYLTVAVEDASAQSGDKGIMAMVVRKDAGASLVSHDGDYSALQVDANGNLRVVGNLALASEHEEDTAHSSGHMGIMTLGVRHDALSPLAADGDYIPFTLDSNGALYVNVQGTSISAVWDPRFQTETDVGSDEAGVGEIPSVTTAAWVDVVSIPVAASKNLQVFDVDSAADKLTQFRLAVFNDSTLVKIKRVWPVTENLGNWAMHFTRPWAVTGGATITLKLQAKRLRGGSADANVSGGINAAVN